MNVKPSQNLKLHIFGLIILQFIVGNSEYITQGFF